MTNEEAKKKAKEFKNSLGSATSEEVIVILENVMNDMQFQQFRKPLIKYKAQAIITNKKPGVNNITRETYQRFITMAKACAMGNTQMLSQVKSFANTYQLVY